LTLLIGQQDGHLACKKLGVGLFMVTVLQELCTSYSSSCRHRLGVLSSNNMQNGDSLVLAYPGCPGKCHSTRVIIVPWIFWLVLINCSCD